MSMKESVATSWRMSSIGNSGARSSGPTGWSVPGCSGGGGGVGRSGITLYHCRGISDSSRVILVRSVTTTSSYRTSFPHHTPQVPPPLPRALRPRPPPRPGAPRPRPPPRPRTRRPTSPHPTSPRPMSHLPAPDARRPYAPRRTPQQAQPLASIVVDIYLVLNEVDVHDHGRPRPPGS